MFEGLYGGVIVGLILVSDPVLTQPAE